jgi:hypothetical protein
MADDNETIASLASQVAVLTGQLQELRYQLGRYQGEVGQLRARHSEDYGYVMVLLAEVRKLSVTLDEALEKRRLNPPPAPYWRGLEDTEQRKRLAELRSWVEDFLRVHYPDYASSLPSCWINHPEAVWELSTLMTEWHRIYDDDENRDLSAALWWHERWFPGVLARLHKAISCDEYRSHQPNRSAGDRSKGKGSSRYE